MEADQRSARIFGVLFLITFVTSIGALALFQPVLDDPAGYIAGGGKESQIYLGAFLELLLIISNVGTAVVLYPIVRRQNELLAIGYVAGEMVIEDPIVTRWLGSTAPVLHLAVPIALGVVVTAIGWWLGRGHRHVHVPERL